jgi:hypothetical protein
MDKMNNALIIILYVFKKIDTLIKDPKTNKARYQKNKGEHGGNF